MITKPRVAIFQAEWALSINTANLLTMLARNGFISELFVYNSMDFCDLEDMEESPQIIIHWISHIKKGMDSVWFKRGTSKLTVSSEKKKKKKVFTLFKKVIKNIIDLFFLCLKVDRGIIPQKTIKKSLNLMEPNTYQCLIGIEKKGLIWAGQIGKMRNEPFLYYSLELYTWDYPGYYRFFSSRRVKYAEERYHGQSKATIIQDERRAQYLLADNKVKNNQILLLPVSLLGSPRREKSDFFQKKFSFKNNHKIVLQIGQIAPFRFGFELAHVAQRFPDNWKMVLHGWGKRSSLEEILKVDAGKKVTLSLERQKWNQLYNVVTSAHIGLVLYKSKTMNDYLTAFSSEKLALYLQCGLPVITFDYEGYEIIEKMKCGVCINSLQDLPQAVDHIINHYSVYRENSFSAFEKYYEYSSYFKGILNFLNGLSKLDS